MDHNEGMDADRTDGRDETVTERMDRNWNELLQELRVTQTGAQLLMGFLLTIPFQQRFADLDDYQRNLYLALVAVALLATALIVAPVSLHRELFRRHMKPELVQSGNVLAKAGLIALSAALVGVGSLLFDVVVSRVAGLTVAAATAGLLVGAWWVLPRVLVSRHEARRP